MPQIDANRNASRKAVKRIVRKKKAASKPKPPTRTQIRNSRAQERQYVSQGKAVEKTANAQKKAAAEAPYLSQAAQVENTANFQRKGLKRKKHTTLIQPLTGGKAHRPTVFELEAIERHRAASPSERRRLDTEGLRRVATHNQEALTKKLAPGLRVLEQTTRPLHALAATERSAIKSIKKTGSIDPVKALHAASRGIQNKDKSTSSDVLKDLGVKNKTVRSVVGLPLDIVGDPTTYITGGAGSVARHAALKEGERVAAKTAGKATPVREAATKKEANRATLRSAGGGADAPTLAERAAARKLKTGDQTKGVTVKFAGREVPGVRKVTAVASKPVRKVARKVTPERVRTGTRNLAGDVNPNIAPAGVSAAEHEAATRAIRTARAQTNRGVDAAQKRAIAIKKKVGEKNYATVIDALESGNLKSLSPELREAAVQIRSQFRYANRLRKQAGIKGGERKNYVPHHLTDEAIEEEAKKAGGGVGSKTIRPSSSKARAEQRSLAELRAAEPGRYSENLAQLYADRIAEGSASSAKAGLNRKLADMGKTVKAGDSLPNGTGTQAVFQIKGSDIREVTDKAELQRLADEGGKSGRYVILSKDIVKRATEGTAPSPNSGKGIGRALDVTTAQFKRVATATPGFHLRNFAGDTGQHYTYARGHNVPKNFVQAGRVLKASGRHDAALRKLEPTAKTGKSTLKTKQYGKVTYDEVATQLAKHGAFRSGYTASEIPELAASGSKKGVKLSRVRLPHAIKAAALNREDLPRLATAVDALRNGATWEEAASHVANVHFDYQHLTSFERNVARRVMPFYTFTARNIPYQARTLVTKPGKYANYQKVREEAAKATGADERDQRTKDTYRQLAAAGVVLPKQWEAMLSEWEQRNVGVPISWKGHKFTLSVGLPLGDLNEFPGAAGSKQADEYFNKFMSMTNPLMKDPVEFFSNFSFFFRDQIERENAPLVAAPDVVGQLPQSLRDELGITKINDKNHPDRKVWAWPAKTDYIAKSIPGTPQYAQQLLTSGTDRRGKGKPGKLLAYAGIKAVPLDPISNAVSLTYERETDIRKQLGKLNQQGIDAKNPNAAYVKLNGQLKILANIRAEAHLTDPQKTHLLVKANDELLQTVTKKAKVKKTSDNFYYTKEYQGLLDREKVLRQQIKDLTGAEAPKQSLRLSRRPLTLRQQLEKERDKLKSGGLREELTKQLERDRAKTNILAGG